MFKNFNVWNLLKIRLNNRRIPPKEFKVGEIWWCHIGLNIGSEEDGKSSNFERPVFILKKLNRGMLLRVPCSTKVRDRKHYYVLNNEDGGFNLNFSQTKTFRSKRLIRNITFVGNSKIRHVKSFFREYV